MLQGWNLTGIRRTTATETVKLSKSQKTEYILAEISTGDGYDQIGI